MKLTRVGAGARRVRRGEASSWIAAQLMPGVRPTTDNQNGGPADGACYWRGPSTMLNGSPANVAGALESSSPYGRPTDRRTGWVADAATNTASVTARGMRHADPAQRQEERRNGRLRQRPNKGIWTPPSRGMSEARSLVR